MLGGDGLLTLALSTTVAGATAGLSLLPPLARVVGTARRAPSGAEQPRLLVVLGKRLQRDRPDRDFRARLERALALHQAGRARHILLVGGRAHPDAPSEAEAGRDWLRTRGVPASHLSLEDASRHTLENLTGSRALLDDAAEGRPVLISNRYHLERCAVIADGLGIDYHPCAAEEGFRLSPRIALQLVREAYFLHWYWVGKGWSRLTRNRKSLARIS